MTVASISNADDQFEIQLNYKMFSSL